MNAYRMNFLRSVEHSVNMKRLVSSCLTSLAGCRSCGGGRHIVPRALSTSFRSYATGKGQEADPHSVLKTKGTGKGSVSVDLPETQKEVSLYDIF